MCEYSLIVRLHPEIWSNSLRRYPSGGTLTSVDKDFGPLDLLRSGVRKDLGLDYTLLFYILLFLLINFIKKIN
jgi:hypothetical protein